MQNFFDFTGKVVLVTGASSGIGRATAEFFGRCGASVAISYLKNKTGADETVRSDGLFVFIGATVSRRSFQTRMELLSARRPSRQWHFRRTLRTTRRSRG